MTKIHKNNQKQLVRSALLHYSAQVLEIKKLLKKGVFVKSLFISAVAILVFISGNTYADTQELSPPVKAAPPTQNLHSPSVSAATCPGKVTTVQAPPSQDGSTTSSGSAQICIGSIDATNIPPEVSALMLNPEYASLMSQVLDKAKADGQTVSISGYSARWDGVVELASVSFSKKPIQNPSAQSTRLGSIAGQVMLDDIGNYVIIDISYTGNPTPPGGASVGNQ